MKSVPSIVFLIIAAIAVLSGCGGKGKTLIESTTIIAPAERVEQYIRLIYKTTRRDDAYEMLTPESRTKIPLKDFKSLLKSELSDVLLVRNSSELDIRVDQLREFPIDDNHHIVYSLVRISFPYDYSSEDIFRLTKFHVYRQENVWYLEPFIHRETFTKRMVPSLVVGYQKELDEKRTEFYDIIGEDLLMERKKYETTISADENVPNEKELEKIGSLVIPDLRKENEDSLEGENEEAGSTESSGKTTDNLTSLIIVGRLHYQIGNIAAAEKAFRKVLEIDSENEIAQDFMAKCADIRRLQEEKKKQIELYEKLLELDEKEEELKGKTEGK